MNVIHNIPYTTPADDIRTMDVYLPTSGNGALFFYVHGGGLEAGDKDEGKWAAEYLAERGYAVVCINYRMYPAFSYPDFLWDAAEALSFVKNHLQEYGAKRLYVGGSSAGGYISMMLCFDEKYLAAYGMSNQHIAGYFHDAGQPTAHFRVLKSMGIDPRRLIVDETSALYHVGTALDYPRMRFIVSDNDLQNRYEQTQLMLSTLRHFGFEKADSVLMHGDHCAYITALDEKGESVFGQMIEDFLKTMEGENA